jgi:phosphoribosylformimino-5-aminoimidazole carboxamide ribotide isomerase
VRFRPCIDLHQGQVKQIVGSTLRDGAVPETNFVAEKPPAYFAELYRHDNLHGGHVIMLGPGNEQAATHALATFPGGLQLGGGINANNAPDWLDRGAAQVIVTSYAFRDSQLHRDNLQRVVDTAGRERLVLDLSCGLRDGRYVVMTDRWQQATDFEINADNLAFLAESCCEFLVHATDVEGKQQGVDEELVALLGEIAPIPTTYAGGVRSRADIDVIDRLGQGKLDFTVGSALDIFGGTGLNYEEMAAVNGAK